MHGDSRHLLGGEEGSDRVLEMAESSTSRVLRCGADAPSPGTSFWTRCKAMTLAATLGVMCGAWLLCQPVASTSGRDINGARSPANVPALVRPDADQLKYMIWKEELNVTLDADQLKYFSEAQATKIADAFTWHHKHGKRNIFFALFDEHMFSMTLNLFCGAQSWLKGRTDVGVVVLAIDTSCDALLAPLQALQSHLRSPINSTHIFKCISLTTRTKPPAPTAHETAKGIEYMSARYSFFIIRKLVLWGLSVKLAAARGNFDWFLFSDVDVVVKTDPFFYMDMHDRIAWMDTLKGVPMACMGDLDSTTLLNSGFCFLRPRRQGSDMLRTALSYLQAKNTLDGGDMGALQQMVYDGKLRVDILPSSKFANGLIYFARKEAPNAGVIHANFISRSSAKEQCLHLSGNWFVDQHGACLDTVPTLTTQDFYFTNIYHYQWQRLPSGVAPQVIDECHAGSFSNWTQAVLEQGINLPPQNNMTAAGFWAASLNMPDSVFLQQVAHNMSLPMRGSSFRLSEDIALLKILQRYFPPNSTLHESWRYFIASSH